MWYIYYQNNQGKTGEICGKGSANYISAMIGLIRDGRPVLYAKNVPAPNTK